MRKTLGALSLVLLALACEGPDPERDGFVLLDQSALEAGIEVEISGVRHGGHLPLVVPEGAEAAIVRPTGAEAFEVDPGELVRVTGTAGELRRGEVPRDRIWVDGESASVRAFAEMIGAEATRLRGGGWTVAGPRAFVLASLMGGMTDVRVLGSAPGPNRDPSLIDVGVFLGSRAPLATPNAPPVASGPTPDAAALVGLYMHGDIGLLLDATGGYTLFDSQLENAVATGTYRPRPGGVDFVPNGGGPNAVMELEGEHLVDDLGIGFRAVEGQN